MKSLILTSFWFINLLCTGQIVNDTIPQPLRYFYHCNADSIVSESHSDSVDYVVKTTSLDGLCQEFLCEFDSVSYTMSLGGYEPVIYIRNANDQNDFLAISFFEGMSKVKQIHTRMGAIVTKINFSFWGDMVSYFECDYSVCDKCISEGYGAKGKDGMNETVYYTPISCISNLEWIKLKPEFKEQAAVPNRIVIKEGSKCLVDRLIPLPENYTNQ